MSDNALVAKERLDLMNLMDHGHYKVPKRMVDENLVIGTWNIENLGHRHTTRALQYIADIIERFDLVAIQEVKTNFKSLKKLMAMLPGEYDILVSDVTGNWERFAFLFDRRTITPTGLAAEIGFKVSGATHTGYQLHRMPYAVSFRAGRFDFVIVNVHIYDSDATHKEEEIRTIAAHLNAQADNFTKGTVFDPDFILAGDFNIKKKDDRYFSALTKNGFEVPDKMKTIKTNWGQKHTFDKISYLRRSDSFFFVDCGVVPFKNVVYQDKDPAGGQNEISDHLPLWAEFQINELTQQLNAALVP